MHNDMAAADFGNDTATETNGLSTMPSACDKAAPLGKEDVLLFPLHKRIVSHYQTRSDGTTELHLYCGEQDITFDRPELFAFGEALAAQGRFTAGDATTWGHGYDWPSVRELLMQLMDAELLHRADTLPCQTESAAEGFRSSPLPPAVCTTPRTWLECEAITRELTGYALELGYLELIVPVFRVAHMALDAEGRQVGEANVFPMPLRLDIPTVWRICPHPGSRYKADRPMNVAALKSMRNHWPQMMAALRVIRQAFLNRFPHARNGWTAGDLERLSVLVLALPAYLLMRAHNRVENADLHPVLSCLFRVTDGLRMVMHQMLFLPTLEPTREPNAAITGAEVFDYAERNYVFFSPHGVCAGPNAMIREFLNVLIDGSPAENAKPVAFAPQVQHALADLEEAFDYGLYGLQAHAVAFSLWPAMGRSYERLWSIVENGPHAPSPWLKRLRDRLRENVKFLRTESLIASEELRLSRERAYADMFVHCASGLRVGTATPPPLAQCIATAKEAELTQLEQRLCSIIRRRTAAAPEFDAVVKALTHAVTDYLATEQAFVRAACGIQQHVNHALGRPAPARPFTSAAFDLNNRMLNFTKRLPYLTEEMERLFDIHITVSAASIDIEDRCAE